MNSESGGERNSIEIASPSQENDQSKNFRTLTLLYSNYLWSRFSNSPFIGKLSSFCRQFGRARSRRQKLCLPLPLPSKSVHSSLILTEASRIYDVLEDVFEHILSNMHNVQKNLQYWQAKAEGSNAQKAYFMMFERGPRALIGETVEFGLLYTKSDKFSLMPSGIGATRICACKHRLMLGFHLKFLLNAVLLLLLEVGIGRQRSSYVLLNIFSCVFYQ